MRLRRVSADVFLLPAKNPKLSASPRCALLASSFFLSLFGLERVVLLDGVYDLNDSSYFSDLAAQSMSAHGFLPL